MENVTSINSRVEYQAQSRSDQSRGSRARFSSRRQRVDLAEHLVRPGHLSPAEASLLRRKAAEQGRSLTEILAEDRAVPEPVLVQAIADFEGTGFVDLAAAPACAEYASLLAADAAIALSSVPYRRTESHLIVATSRPHMAREICAAFPNEEILLALASRDDITRQITRLYGPELARRAESRAPEEVSCRVWSTKMRHRHALLGLGAIGGLAAAFPSVAAAILAALALGVFLCNTALKLAATCSALRARVTPRARPVMSKSIATLKPEPVVTILVPLYKERDITRHLIQRLSQLRYPGQLLDVILILEEDDVTTHAAIERCELPHWMRAITVPHGHPRTKPRALNYALPFARGAIIGIYDAEDLPEPDQIEKVVARFQTAPPDIACLQGQLDYYNARHNWISRCFTIEYATWFRLLLPGIERLGLALPLGGTTLFLRRDALLAVGGWDAHNVTEDAELGFRLARAGYRTEMIETTTYEEANSAIWPWIRQRSRWLKGYAVTWATAMRAPARLWRELGPRRFIGFQVQVAGAVLGFLMAPVLWSFLAIPLGLPHPLSSLLGPGAVMALTAMFVASLALSLIVPWLALRAQHVRGLRPWVLLMPIYFMLATLAAMIAVSETLVRPFHWAKTAHGRFGGLRGTAPCQVADISFKRTMNAVDR